jgi:hypothetical protein
MATSAVASAAGTAATARAATTEVAPADENVQGNELRGGFIIPLIALVAIILGILAATHNGHKAPTSP